MGETLALINALALFVIGVFHFYWAAGGKVGSKVVLPEVEKEGLAFKPSNFATVLVGFIFFSLGLFPLIIMNVIDIPLPKFLSDYSMICLGGVFIIRAIGEFNYVGFFKKVKSTKFAQFDTKYFSPLSLILGVFFFLIEFIFRS
tara:strand:- start:1509 stop:1940 length:432 start_codon:yes stop_codon:yes gene_type:complete